MEQVLAALAIVGIVALFYLAYLFVCWCIVVRCPKCRSKRTTILNQEKTYETWRCHRCRHDWDVFISKEFNGYG